jgi:hypothetical protein
VLTVHTLARLCQRLLLNLRATSPVAGLKHSIVLCTSPCSGMVENPEEAVQKLASAVVSAGTRPGDLPASPPGSAGALAALLTQPASAAVAAKVAVAAKASSPGIGPGAGVGAGTSARAGALALEEMAPRLECVEAQAGDLLVESSLAMA